MPSLGTNVDSVTHPLRSRESGLKLSSSLTRLSIRLETSTTLTVYRSPALVACTPTMTRLKSAALTNPRDSYLSRLKSPLDLSSPPKTLLFRDSPKKTLLTSSVPTLLFPPLCALPRLNSLGIYRFRKLILGFSLTSVRRLTFLIS